MLALKLQGDNLAK